MSRKEKIAIGFIGTDALLAAVVWLARRADVAVLSPHGVVAAQERNLILVASLLSLIIVLPVFALTAYIVWKYRESNPRNTAYAPELDGNRKLEALWWLIPMTLIFILSVITWQSSHSLDPTRPLVSAAQPLTIQVVALQWKWLFLYPKQHIASLDSLQIPVNTPVNFELTSDAPMNSFWIPKLGGQMYAMSGMVTHLHLMANQPGDYAGTSANLSGKGFAGMRFTTHAVPAPEFDAWASNMSDAPNQLDAREYQKIRQPGDTQRGSSYSYQDTSLFDSIVMHYTMPAHSVVSVTP